MLWECKVDEDRVSPTVMELIGYRFSMIPFLVLEDSVHVARESCIHFSLGLCEATARTRVEEKVIVRAHYKSIFIRVRMYLVSKKSSQFVSVSHLTDSTRVRA